MESDNDRYWLLTWTTYGAWLPGDSRGFVSSVRDGDGPQVRHNIPGSPYDADLAGLRVAARSQLKHTPILLTESQARVACDQFRETASYRGWQLLACAIMPNHAHIVVGVSGDPDPATLLRDFKSYASRALNQTSRRERWWTESGSRRKLPDEAAVLAAIRYVENQDRPLVVWSVNHTTPEDSPPGERPASAG